MKSRTMQINVISVCGWQGAIRGMRFPKNSDHLCDSKFDSNSTASPSKQFCIFGEKDLDLAMRLTKAGKDHRKFLRMIHVQAAMKMPMSWWTQFDTYKIGTAANSRSRMHRMCERPLTKDDFYIDDDSGELFPGVLEQLNVWIEDFKKTNDKKTWRRIIDTLPISYLQERMVDLNYETLLNIIPARYHEKLAPEWSLFCSTFMNGCQYLTKFLEADGLDII